MDLGLDLGTRSEVLSAAALCWEVWDTWGVCSACVCRTVTLVSEGWACLGPPWQSPTEQVCPWGGEESRATDRP